MMRKPEIMSPAGYWPQLNAAIEAGADAVYFGLKHFSARAKVGFTLGELPDVMRTLHARGVRGYITFNTLIFEHELEEAARTLAAIAQAGADATIMQDYAAVRVAREIAPGMELHASTQMSITNAAGVRFAQAHGLRRVTLARELSLDEVRSIVAETRCELEIFVHGALCVAYSGQCFSSEAWGGRSANRGQCAQACRLPYEMMVDGHLAPLADARYLLSPGDLFALELMPQIVETGVAALKIEGRYKDEQYVAVATRAYRKALDEAWECKFAGVTPAEKLQLEQVYSRGLGPFFLTGTNHQAVVEGRAPRHRGVCLGRVARVDADRVSIEASEANQIAPLKPGDGIVFDAADWRSPEEPEEGGRVYEIAPRGNRIELRFANNAVHFERIRPGDRIWRTHDPDLDRAAKPFLHPPAPVARQPVRVEVIAGEGEPLTAEWSLEKRPEFSVTVKSPAALDRAQNRAVSLEALHEQFGRLGHTPYQLGEVTLKTSGSPFVSASILNQVRRDAVEALQNLQTKVVQVPDLHFDFPRNSEKNGPAPGSPQLHLLIRNPEQLEAAIDLRPASITLDYLDLFGLRPSIERVKAAGIAARVASPRVVKPGEHRILNFLISLDCAILVRSSAMIEPLRGSELIGDFSLNAANSLAAGMYLDLGLTRLTPTHDLNAAQIAELARQTAADRVEAVAYQHLPVFHTEHCVFCRFLSTGTSYRDCGRPCEKHRVELKDPSGRAHPVMADVGCRNTVFGAEAQDASTHLDEWRRAGIRHFRLEFVHESAQQVRQIVRLFETALAGEIPPGKLTDEIAQIAPQGTTQGSLFVPAGYRIFPILQ
jgi:U32 family peptidase